MFTPADRDRIPRHHLEPDEVAHYRGVLIAHADDLVRGACPLCQLTRCPDWRAAYRRLTAGGELLTPPARWQRVAEVDRKPPHDR